MRVQFAESTGDHLGQFVIYAESEMERAILKNFLKGGEAHKMQFCIHGMTYEGYKPGISSFNFGWRKKEQYKPKNKKGA